MFDVYLSYCVTIQSGNTINHRHKAMGLSKTIFVTAVTFKVHNDWFNINFKISVKRKHVYNVQARQDIGDPL